MKEELNKIKLACLQEIENAREVNSLEEVRVT